MRVIIDKPTVLFQRKTGVSRRKTCMFGSAAHFQDLPWRWDENFPSSLRSGRSKRISKTTAAASSFRSSCRTPTAYLSCS